MFKKSTTIKTKAGLGGKQYKTMRTSLEPHIVVITAKDDGAAAMTSSDGAEDGETTTILDVMLPKKALVVEGKVEGTVSTTIASKTFGYLSVNEVPLFISKTTQQCASNNEWQSPSGWFPSSFFLIQHPALSLTVEGNTSAVFPLVNVPVVVMAQNVPEYIMRGADVMMPGVVAILSSSSSQSSSAAAIPTGTFVVLAIQGQPHAFAVGETLQPLKYGRYYRQGESAGSGKGIGVLQVYGDTFHDAFHRQVLQQQQKGAGKGAVGSKSIAPPGFDPEGTYVRPTTEYLEMLKTLRQQHKQQREESGKPGDDESSSEEEEEEEDVTTAPRRNKKKGKKGAGNEKVCSSPSPTQGTHPAAMTTEKQEQQLTPDEVFHFALYECILHDLTPSVLPLSLHELTPKLQQHRPHGSPVIDLKATTYKKILTALKTLQEEDGCVTVQEATGGNGVSIGGGKKKAGPSGTGVFNLVKVWKSSPMMKAHKELHTEKSSRGGLQSVIQVEGGADAASRALGDTVAVTNSGGSPGGDNSTPTLSTKVISVELLVKPKKGGSEELVAIMFPPSAEAGKDGSYHPSSACPLKTVVRRVLDHVRSVPDMVFMADPQQYVAPAAGAGGAAPSKKGGASQKGAKGGNHPAPRVCLDRALSPVVALFGHSAPSDCAITDLSDKVERYVSPEHIITVADRLTGKLDCLRYNGHPIPMDVAVFKYRNHWTTTLVHLGRYGFHLEEVQTYLKNKLGCGVQFGEAVASAKTGKQDSVPEHLIIQGEPTKNFWRVMTEDLGMPRELLNECKRKVFV